MSENARHSFYRIRGKRIFDVALILCALPLVLPVVLGVALAVRLFLGSPVLFWQSRLGLGGREFRLRKFRTMTDKRDARGSLLPDAERVTRFGRILRRTSLDELPELFNVLRGDMSLVGPRPLLMRYLPYFSEVEQRRFSACPGITGLAQINGRNGLAWDKRLACDVHYVMNLSLAFDAGILARTFWQAIRAANVEEVPNLSMLDLDDERRWQGARVAEPVGSQSVLAFRAAAGRTAKPARTPLAR
jgi:lipopolysaccharide/colanic/teichoic acid biosynthesis glycosyltransferase